MLKNILHNIALRNVESGATKANNRLDLVNSSNSLVDNWFPALIYRYILDYHIYPYQESIDPNI